MILMDMKKETASSLASPLNLSAPSEMPSISFSDLLRGVSEKKEGKTVQNGSLILSLASEEKSTKTTKSASKLDTLASLLKNEKSSPQKTKEEPLELNPMLSATLSTKEIKTLVSEAKNYLKERILQSDDYKNSLVKELPKTLKGLIKAAKIFGINISKITVEEVKAHSGLKQTKETKEIIKHDDIKALTAKDDIKSIQSEALNDKKLPTAGLKEVLADKRAVVHDKKVVTTEIQEVHTDKKVVTTEVKEVRTDKKVVTTEIKEVRTDKKIVAKEKKDQAPKADEIDKNFIEKTASINHTEKIKEIKATPLFKAHSSEEVATTQQIVQVKASANILKTESKTPKEKADETLMLLLRGEKPNLGNPVLTADISLATAKIVAPNASADISQIQTKQINPFEKLLHGETSSTELLSANKADSFEVKLNEAKQMIRYLSNDVKTAIEEYKSPFTRVKVQLNPQRLGEVDLTIVQRGKNLHVSISSNNTAINTLAMNANELRVQLNNSGINNATLNFNNSSQNGDSGASNQQQNRQNGQKAQEEYSYFEKEEANEEILSSLEIIVPQYV